jgi:hypothetical protein
MKNNIKILFVLLILTATSCKSKLFDPVVSCDKAETNLKSSITL